MSRKYGVGVTHISSKGIYWAIPNFSDLPQISETIISSPPVKLGRLCWTLSIYPKGSLFHSSVGWFGAAAYDGCSRESGDFINFNVRLSITTRLQDVIVSDRAEYKYMIGYNCPKLINRTEFDLRKNQIMPSGVLYILFSIVNEKDESIIYTIWNKYEEGCKKRSFESWLEQGNQSEKTSGLTDIKKIRKQKWNDVSKEMSILSKEEMGKICEKKTTFLESCTQTEETSGESEIRENYIVAYTEASTQTEEGMGVWWLKQDFEEILRNKNGTDIILTVQDTKFRAHRFILGTRAPAFLSAINDDTKEEVTPVVDLKDVDFDVFSNFLHYLYTGTVNNLTPEKALKLYSVAYKYKVNELKQYCVSHLLANVSVDNFGKVFALSHQYNEKELNDACIEFFQEKSLDIIMTTNWQTFLCENPVIGNGLFIKHLQLIKSVYCKKW